MLGWLANSLTYQTKKAVKSWQGSNEVFQEYKYSGHEKFFITRANHPLKSSLGLLLLFTLLPAVPVVWNYNIVEFFLKSSEADLDKANYIGTIWSIQAALVGLLYPIVIGFVGLLLQNRGSEKVILRSYLIDSSAIFMGLSSLLLVGFIGIQYCIISYLSHEVFRRLFFSDGVWFLFNIYGTFWFLYRTGEFIKPDVRHQNIKRFVINLVYPQEISTLLKSHVFQNAQVYKLIPGVSWGSEQAREVPSISMHSMLGEYGEVALSKRFERKVTLTNVLFRFLGWACKLWLIRATRKTAAVNETESGLFGIRERPSLLFSVLPGELYEKDKSLCRVIGPTKLTFFEKLLIKVSFKFKTKKEKEKAITTYDILAGYQSEVISALNAGQIQRYEDALRDLEDMHILVVDLGKFKDDSGQEDNWANLANSAYWTGRLYQDWNRIYFDIFDLALNQLPANITRYFDSILYTPYRLYSAARQTAGKELTISLMELNVPIWFKLCKLWAKEIENQGDGEHGFAKPCKLRKPAQNWYENAVYSFVGLWEHFLRSIHSHSRNKPMQWIEYRDLAPHFTQHLNDTLLLLLQSSYEGDSFASEWMVDILQKWRSSSRNWLQFNHFPIERPQLITIQLLLKNEDEVRKDYQNDRARAIADEDFSDRIFTICIHNYWVDIYWITLYLLSFWAKEAASETGLPIELIKILLSGKTKKAGGDGHPPSLSATALFQAILRQYFYGGNDYRGILDSVIESTKRIERSPKIPWRIYSGFGAHDLESTKFGQLFMLCLLAKASWNPVPRLESDLRELINSDDQLARDLKQLLDSYLKLLDDVHFDSYKKAYDCIVEHQNQKMSFEDVRMVVKEGLNRISEILDDQRRGRIAQLSIDPERLTKISYAASSEAFDKGKAFFPIHCFRQIVPTGEDAIEKRRIVLKKMNRGEFTSPLMAQLASNEDWYFSETAKSHVALIVLHIIHKQINAETSKTYDEYTYWGSLREFSERLIQSSLSPILLLDHLSRPSWIGDWRNSTYDRHIKLPQGLKVTPSKNSNDSGYVCNFNDILVYHAPLQLGSSYLLAKEMFDELMVRDYEGGKYFNAELKQNYDDKTIVDLELEYAIRVSTKNFPIFCLRYSQTEISN